MYKFDFEPGISVGPLKLGIERKEAWKIMKEFFKSKRSKYSDEELEYYSKLDVRLHYDENRLIAIEFIAEKGSKLYEINFRGEKIWPRTKNKFFSIFKNYLFKDVWGSFYNTDFDIAAQWDDNPPSFLIAKKVMLLYK